MPAYSLATNGQFYFFNLTDIKIVRITNSQIITLEKKLTDAKLEIESFDVIREEAFVIFDYKHDYFFFQLTKDQQDNYIVILKSVYSTESQQKIVNWDSLLPMFGNWCAQIYVDIESGQKIFKPTETNTAPQIQQYKMSPAIKKISPKFDLIFNQAFAAEQYGLNEICGLGYRKAFEFLIKDYVIRDMLKEDAIEVKNMGINEVVKKHIQNSGIQLILHRVLWLGNDHAHYVPVWKTKTINDLKTLIYTTMAWIEANEELARIHKQALKIEKSMPHKKK